ncbi:MAG: P-loop NTPase [Deltaproteobacteria bacterium]|nr:MAG: P-loop NTPase [Deltaproteobacteria bacterium]
MTQQMIVIAGAKGGVGRSTLAVNISWSLAQTGFRTILMDANLGLGNDDILLGLCPESSIKDIFERGKSLTEVAITVRPNLVLIPASSGDYETANANSLAVEGIFYDLENSFHASSYLIIDTEANLSDRTRHLLHCADHVVIVSTPDATALANSYATVKLLASRPLKKEVKVSMVVNQTRSDIEDQETFDQLSRLCKKYLGFSPEFLGAIPHDDKIREASRRHIPFIEAYPKLKASKNLLKIIQNLQTAGKGSADQAFSMLNEYLRPLLTGSTSRFGVTHV